MKLPTQEQIVARIKLRQPKDMFGFEVHEYIKYLDFAHAKEFLQPDVTAEKWETGKSDLSEQTIRSEMQDYMSFAWDKSNNGRGISANRSVQHYQAWVWLLGDDKLNVKMDKACERYEFYGKPILAMICDHFDWDWKQWDDGEWKNDEYSKNLKNADEKYEAWKVDLEW